MRRQFGFLLTLLMVAAACAPGGGSGGGDAGTGEGDGGVAADEVNNDDVVDVDDVVLDEREYDTAAAQIGDPSTMLASAREQGDQIRDHLRAALNHVRDLSVGEPDETGTTEAGKPYAVWTGSASAVDLRFTVARINEDRVRYLLVGKPEGAADSEYKGLITGIFIKKAPKKGGGRLHLSLTNISDLFESAHWDGSVHVKFANFDENRRARRVAYVNVTDRDVADSPPLNYGADLLRAVGDEGRFRAVLIGADVVPELDGVEALAMRLRWDAAEGGRGDAVIAHIAPAPRAVLGHAHECWDGEGLRTAYADTFAANDAENPNEGDTSSCVGFAQEDLPEDAAATDAEDLDDEVEQLLDESGANDIDETEAADNGDL